YRDPYLPDDYELPCDQPDAIANCADGWCTIEPGCFFMGSPWCEWSRARDTANPIQVTLTHRYRIQQFELTQAEWTGLGLPNPSGEEDGSTDCIAPDCPVGRVNWYEALAFANLRSRAEGLPDCYALDDCTGELGAGRLARATLATGTASACRDPAPSRSSMGAAFRSPPAGNPLPAQTASEVCPLRGRSSTRFAHCARLAMRVSVRPRHPRSPI
ncbi:MAG TPA: SUMF1/EgtB/PvdO family nonheme iron enzyme, partial [Polyangiaceae bacterium]|nr:SUMF1/EgtB/PvdO family nonheme iron enzyme [Polyangiaceae bacterium]